MKRLVKSSRLFKSLLLAGLLAGPVLAYTSMAAPRTDDVWSPFNVFTDVHGNQAAYWDDPGNWALNYAPVIIDTNQVPNGFYNAAFNGSAITCAVTNTAQVTEVGQLMVGLGGSGLIEIYPGAQFRAGFSGIGDDWTGIGFVNGPGFLTIDPGADVTLAGHLWIGQGGGNLTGTVVVNGGTLHVGGGEFGLGWNGGTNYCWVTNGGSIYLRDWASKTLGAPGTANGFGILDIGANSQVVVTNNATGFMNAVITNHQLIAFGGNGTVQYVYNAGNNTTIITALAPAGPTTPVFSLQPTNAIVTLGGTVTLHGTASPATTYQWMFNNALLPNGNGVSGATTATLTIANFTAAETGAYSLVATNAAANQSDRPYSSSAVVTVSGQSFNLFPVITINGVNGTTYAVQSATAVNGPYTTFATVTAGAGPLQVVDTTSPLSMAKFYRVVLP